MTTENTPAAAQLDLEPVLNWTHLARKDEVELVLRSGKTLASGRIDTIALDGSVFWIIQDDGRGRSMVLPDEDVLVFRHRRPRNRRRRAGYSMLHS
jgi:hypothetical protein